MNIISGRRASLNSSFASGCLRGLRLLGICTLTSILAACAQPQKMLYNWQSYQPGVYAYLKDDGADHATQVQLLEQNIETARSANQSLPPGFHAHLGMLYLKLGDGSKAIEHLQSEKLAFPEAGPFMDFLLRNAEVPAMQVDKPVPQHHISATKQAAPTLNVIPAKQDSKKGA